MPQTPSPKHAHSQVTIHKSPFTSNQSPMTSHHYTLQKYTGKNSRHTCPKCGKAYQFTKYFDTVTGNVLGDNIGKCNRVDKCGYHKLPPLETKCYFVSFHEIHDYSEKAYKIVCEDEYYYIPKSQTFEITEKGCYLSDYTLTDAKAPPYFEMDCKYFTNNEETPLAVEVNNPVPQPPARQPTYIDDSIFKASQVEYHNNNLIKFIYSILNSEQVNQLVKLYNIGTSSRWNGGTTVFWQLDTNNKVRTGKLIKYNPSNGKRIKNNTNWVHSVLKISNFNLKQCLFGEHLLNQFPNKTIGIVESEKTAIIASVFLPGLLWLATGGVENLNKEKTIPLKGRNVILFPDASKDGRIYLKWKEKGNQFGFQTSNYLEQYTNDKQKASGVDIADFLKSKKKPDAFIKIEPNQETQTIEYMETTPQIPYNTPSPVAIIDCKIKNPPKFEGADLIIKKRIFTSPNDDKIELVGVSDSGDCGNWKAHDKQNRPCRICMLNCLHSIKINGKLQKREYTQLEILLMQ